MTSQFSCMKNFVYIFVVFCYFSGHVPAQSYSAGEKEMVLQTPLMNVFGTFVFPENISSFPCVLIIPGSGPTDRDGNSIMLPGKNNSLKLLADSLANHGIASLRYDKRGVGKSRSEAFSEVSIRFDDYVHDAGLWLNLLNENDSIEKLGIIGHSEGSLIGMIAAHRAPVDFFISLNGGGMRADSIIIQQLKSQPKSIQLHVSKILSELVAGRLVDSIPAALTSLFRPTVQPYLISWFHHDPGVEISRFNIPVLIIQGTSDLQVDPENAVRLKAAHPPARLLKIKNMNHVLKITGDDPVQNINAYSNPDLPVPKILIKTIVAFIENVE